jgi:hypothetical protein
MPSWGVLLEGVQKKPAQSLSRTTTRVSSLLATMATMTPTIRRSDDFIMSLGSSNVSPNLLYTENCSPDCVMTQMWIGGTDVESYVDGALPKMPRFVTSPSTFKPLAPPNNSIRGATNIPRTSPFEYRKPSPTPSHHTNMTADSGFDSFSTLDTSRPSSRNGAMPTWVGPRDATVCRVLETSFDAHARRSPLMDLNKTKNGRREDDPVRKSRIKTEMCMHYENGTHCPFGVNCTYAHGEDELQMTKLMDLHRAGLVELETYRTKSRGFLQDPDAPPSFGQTFHPSFMHYHTHT